MATRESDRPREDSMGTAASVRWPVPFVLVLWLLCCGAYGILYSVPDRQPWLEALRQIAYLAPFILAFVTSVAVYRVAAERERRLWRGLSWALGVIAFSESYVSAYVIAGRTIDAQWAALPALLGMVAALMLISTLFRLTDFRTLSRAVGTRHIVDAAGTSLLAFGLVLAGVVAPMEGKYHGMSGSDGIAAAVFSVLGLIMLIATAVNFATRGWSHWRVCERQVILGVGVYGFATLLWPLWYLGSVVDRMLPWDSIIEIMWMSGAFLVFSGAYIRLRKSAGVDRFLTLPRMRPRKHGPLSTLAPTAFTFAIPFFGYLALTADTLPAFRGGYAVAALGLTFVVAGRSAIAAIENEFLFDKAVNDPLTDLYGHRYFHERLQLELDMAGRRGDRVSVAVVDLDGFARVNGLRGHAFGDEVLKQVAEEVSEVCRSGDVVCRLGADEFAVILPGAAEADAVAVAERIRGSLERVDSGAACVLTASVGIASYPDDGFDREDLMRKADGALYWAKYHGKDRVVVFDESVVESLSAHDRVRKLEEQSHLGTVRALAAAVDARDPLTQFHSRNVAVLAVMLAEELGIEEERRQIIEIAALLHDVGKIGISDRVLRKRGPLTTAEMRHIREHPALGERILVSTQIEEILPWVRHHHERWDGAGYPDGCAGEDIPFEARLLCICDAYDAMTSGRPYRESMSSTSALQELDLCIGTQFDPALTEAFIRMVGRRRLLRPDTVSAREEQARQS